ncbi:hypothetical protein CKO11_06815 [Rhodobacter sp. TJ_12]|uniref:hypothetical protein n=1 Tax=Rhodobacter sp. TJ_12 TaxID=2029399 RepID=UPI001CBB2C85|nr:hypothetical protein [Rhodobacter sp. TJ_12]MBZ4022167.1 hypothetical protein [Rhodobacter sp. TJ_12]
MRLAPGTVPNELIDVLMDGETHRLETLCNTMIYSKEQIIRAAVKLADHGLMDRHSEPGEYRLSERGLIQVRSGFRIKSGPTRAHGKIRRQHDTFRVRAWKAMRVLGIFTLGEVIAAAERGEADPGYNLRHYMRVLIKAGYVIDLPSKVVGTKPTSPGFKRFRLIKNTGALAPVYRPRQKVLFDFNTGTEIAIGEAVPCL